MTDQSYVPKRPEKERVIDEALGFHFIDGKWEPIFEITPEMENEIYAAGVIGPEGLTVAFGNPKETK
jgi:hypothetical protein